jgi:plasmid stability protein
MAHLSIRGLDEQAMAELKRRASRQNDSVNTLVLQLIDQGLGRTPRPTSPRRHDDLDALAGCWSADEARDFERSSAPFGDLDAALWK